MIRPRVGAGSFAQPFCAAFVVRITATISAAVASGTVAITSDVFAGLVDVNIGPFCPRRGKYQNDASV